MNQGFESFPTQHPERRRTISWRRIGLFTIFAAIVALGLLAANLKWRRTTTNHTEPPRAVAAAVNSDESSNPAEQRDEIPSTSDLSEGPVEPASPGARTALAQLDVRLQRAPDDVDALIDRGATYYRLRDFEKSEADLALAVKLAPRDPRVWEAYGYLQGLRHRQDAAVAAYDRAISLGSRNVDVFCNRAKLSWRLGKHQDAIADWTRVIDLLKDNPVGGREGLIQRLYACRGQSWAELENWDRALADFRHVLELDPASLIPRVHMARIHFTRRDYDRFSASVLEAIDLNPDDAGSDFQPTTVGPLSAEAVEHGEQQLTLMLNDRPALAEHLSPGDDLWIWAVRKFGGESTGVLVNWNASDPGPFEADSGFLRNRGRAQIRVQDPRADSSSDKNDSFERLWRSVVFELHNVDASETFRRINQQALDGQISREEYILAMCSTENRSKQRTRSFYVKFFLPWMLSKDLSPACAYEWYCYSFIASDGDRRAYWQRRSHWGYYSASFDVLGARSAFDRGDYAQMAKHLALLEARQASLTSSQLASLRYWQDKAAHLRARDEQHNLKAKSENSLESPDTYPVAVPR